jgi:hypothetical protein
MLKQPKHTQVGPVTPSKEQNSLVELLEKRGGLQLSENTHIPLSPDFEIRKSD